MQSVDKNHADKSTILVVEDSPTQSEKLKYFLEVHGFHVRVACNGKEGLVEASRENQT
jgi:DNA-binding response OmpR family regulator